MFSRIIRLQKQLFFSELFSSIKSLDMFMKGRHVISNPGKFYTPPFILAPLKDKQTELGEISGDRRERSQTMFCAYCLSEDQRWLMVSLSNEKGNLLESTLINVEIPGRTRRRKASVRKHGLQKMMEFVVSVMAQCVQPWRLVVGRLGRVGHGELKEWACLLNKKALVRYSRLLREKCAQCAVMPPYEMPSILSACLVSLEADTSFQVFPDQFTPDDRFSSSCNTCQLSTPEDASSTHILVFPTSATTQNTQGPPLSATMGVPLEEEDDFFPDLPNEDLGAIGDEIGEGLGDFFPWADSPGSTGMISANPTGFSHPDSPGSRQTGLDGHGGPSKVCFTLFV